MGVRETLGGGQSTPLSLCLLACSVVFLVPQGWGAQSPEAVLLENRCSGCHAPREEGGKLDAIEFQRKTPEGWQMTIDRMVRGHGAQVSADEARVLIKYLSDHYGLAPAEVQPFRYVIEKRNNTVEQLDVPKGVQGACVQCHSYARTALQRRTPVQWERLLDAKAALLPNIENETGSSGFLDDLWLTVARQEAVPYLTEKYPFMTEEWKKWQAAPKPNYAGSWKVIGHDPGKGGDYTGRLTLKAVGTDQYEGTFTHEFADGSTASGKTTVIIYTGFQWRGIAQLDGGKKQKEIFFATEDGSVVSGRRLLTDIGDLGTEETLYRTEDEGKLLAVVPAALKAGTAQKVKLFGMHLPTGVTAQAIAFGAGVSVRSLSHSQDDTIVAEVVVAEDAPRGPRQVKISGVGGEAPLSVYGQVDYIRLSPEQAFARPGGVRAPKVSQQFEAVGYLNGADGKKGTDDDVRVGRVGPVRWQLNEYVRRTNDDDVRFVGAIDEHGLFTPAVEGPNPQRHLSEGNVGDVWVEAWYQPDGGKRPMGARAFLLVMPPKFNFQPLD
jgi:quinohemoprotein amine dehydrogenase